jgi:hypothetical protein
VEYERYELPDAEPPERPPPLPLDEIIADGFSTDEAKEFAPAYLERLRVGWDQLEASVRRTGLLLVLSFVLFELLEDATTGEFTLGPLKLNDVEGIVRILPAASAFLLFELLSLYEARNRYRRVHTLLMRRLHPKIEQHDLDTLLWPPTLDLTGVARITHVGHPADRAQLRLLTGTGVAVLMILVLGAFALEISQLWRLFDRFGFDDVVTWLVAAFAALNLVRAAAVGWLPETR